MKTILFYWSRGADTRVRILKKIGSCSAKGQGCYLNTIAASLKLSHVGIKKHLDLLVEEGYVKAVNPGGKPVFLELTHRGRDVLGEFSQKAAAGKKQ
jgi:predicted ArsR family transcriptional regulator